MANVTIIVPVYNASRYLQDCLISIINQSYKDWKCLIVNDGSTDDSQTIIDEYCRKDYRFVSLNKINEKSADLARKFAFKYVQTKWVMPIDSDDVIESDYIEKMLHRQNETGADIVMSRFIGCKTEVSGENYTIPIANFDMTQVLSGRQVCIDNIGGWTSSINGALYSIKLTNNVLFGPYMNSDEFSQRLIEYNAKHIAFCNAKYFYRNNVGVSCKVSIRMFDRTLVDMQLEKFVYDNFPEREDKILALAWQRVFNLIYLTADYNIHKNEFTKDEQEKASKILRKSYNALNRKTARKAAPIQSLMLTHSFTLFSLLATTYVKYKRSHGGKFYYR